MHFWQVEKSSIDLQVGFVDYKGPTQLPQHFVKNINMCPTRWPMIEGVVVEVILERQLLTNILTVFFPTGILILISNLLERFHHNYLDMVVSENITLLLVLTML